MRRLLFIAAPVAMLLSGCAGMLSALTAPPPPSALANKTVLDEQGDYAVQLAYKAARTYLEFKVDSGKLKGAAARSAADFDNKAFAAISVVHRAYLAGNSNDYDAALTEARAAVAELLAALK